MCSNETVSIIMGIYNCADTLSEAIDSIIKQTYTNWELILCDDCSTDNKTYELALAYRDKYPDKIIVIRNHINSKLAYSLNRCLEKATGKFIARMDGDDISVINRLEKQVNFLKNNPEYHLVGTLMRRFDNNGEHDVIPMIEYPNKYSLKKGVPFSHATIMTYKYVYDELGGYNERLFRSQDYELWFRFYAKGYKGYNIQEPLYLVREDIHAIKRRTLKNRISVLLIQYNGYKQLNYPLYWYYMPILIFFKAFVPKSVICLYRKYQSNKFINK